MTSKALLILAVVILVAAATAQDEFPIAKPGCEDRCGNTKIPYPFGLTLDCSYSKMFLLTCNKSTNPPMVTIESVANVTDITPDGKMYINYPVARDCYDMSVPVHRGRPRDILDNFMVSPTENVFVAIGCDTKLDVSGYTGDRFPFESGCTSICYNKSSVGNTCPGIGCCQIPLQSGSYPYSLRLSSPRNHRDILDFNPCSYALIMEKTKFNYSLANPPSTTVKTLPMVIEWKTGFGNCTNNKTESACGENAACFNLTDWRGHKCNCYEGYVGNPYLPDGCQDIDECKNKKLNDCEINCINTPGNYTCVCPKGYHGDGRRNGQGCIADRSSLKFIFIIIGGICINVLLVISGWLYFGIKKRKLIRLKEKYFKENGGIMLQQRLAGRGGTSDAAKIYTAQELKKATDNFSDNNIIGKGGYGIVYKGTLRNRIVAIKKSKFVNRDQIEQFINEVIVLSQINHRNVVKLLGCCLETEVPLLVYEFISNGTLFSYIHDERKASTFSWDLRLRIAAETAGVLGYLHSEASIPIIHRDVKSNNVLLDDNMTAKVSDFGASRLAPTDGGGISTVVQGTLGYLDPEYLLTSQLTEKSDVYSFGVLLVELMTGKDVFSNERPDKERSLAMYFLSALEEGRLFEVIEDCVAKEGNREQVSEIGKLVRRCLSVKGEERPTMKEVAMELEGLRMMGMGKHPWVNVKVMDGEETELLLLPNRSIENNLDSGHGEKSGESSGVIGFDTLYYSL